jgi:hypothetical protein
MYPQIKYDFSILLPKDALDAERKRTMQGMPKDIIIALSDMILPPMKKDSERNTVIQVDPTTHRLSGVVFSVTHPGLTLIRKNDEEFCWSEKPGGNTLQLAITILHKYLEAIIGKENVLA